MLNFWFAVHLEKLEAAQKLLDLDPLIQKVVTNLRQKGKKMLKRKADRDWLIKQKGLFSKKEKNPIEDDSDALNQMSEILNKSAHIMDNEYKDINYNPPSDEEDDDPDN